MAALADVGGGVRASDVSVTVKDLGDDESKLVVTIGAATGKAQQDIKDKLEEAGATIEIK